MSVISGLIVIIIMNTPISVVTDVMSVVILWLRLIPKVSTSLVILESTSPTVLDSKYARGILLIFSEISFLILKLNFWDMPLIIYPCINENSALTQYKPRSISKITPIL